MKEWQVRVPMTGMVTVKVCGARDREEALDHAIAIATVLPLSKMVEVTMDAVDDTRECKVEEL